MNFRKAVARHATIRSLGYRIIRARAHVARAGAPPRVLVNSFPKAGTHVVSTALDHFPDMRSAGIHIHPRPFTYGPTDESDPRVAGQSRDWDRVHATLSTAKPGQYVTSHFPPQPSFVDVLEDLGYRTIFVYRDPRDIVVSTVMYALRLRRHPQHRRFVEAYTTDEDRMLAMIRGFPPDELGAGMGKLSNRLRKFLPWMEAPDTLPCRFEDLVGAAGGGSADVQSGALRAIGRHIHRPLTGEMASEIARRTWTTKSATFRSGVIGEWRTRFTDEVRAEFSREVDGTLMAAYGYKGEA